LYSIDKKASPETFRNGDIHKLYAAVVSSAPVVLGQVIEYARNKVLNIVVVDVTKPSSNRPGQLEKPCTRVRPMQVWNQIRIPSRTLANNLFPRKRNTGNNDCAAVLARVDMIFNLFHNIIINSTCSRNTVR
jgi:hypothetical protein